MFIIIPLILGYIIRKYIIKQYGLKTFNEIKTILPSFSATGVLLIIFVSVLKVSDKIAHHPILFINVGLTLFLYFIIQTIISIIIAKILNLKYENAMILILGATASSQAISLSVAATNFTEMTVFVLSFKPVLQVGYILFLIYYIGPKLKKFLI
ncbi:hypothetical protein [Deferribacter desulfuricans]|uniref:hypothetical protein n=1 Tax=Deferribacter desulfuricans TaxID=197162 RepID=UPI00129A3881|nr:hypothetical protein [Deferribacter desulfuricans]